MKYMKKKEQPIYVIIGALFLLVLLMFSTFMVDSITKKAKLVEIKTQKITTNEKLRVYGMVKNIGSYFITKCYLNVKITNKPKGFRLTGSNIYKTRGFGDLTKKTKSDNSSVVTYKKLIAKPLKIGKQKRFSFYLKYPSHFRAKEYKYDLDCL